MIIKVSNVLTGKTHYVQGPDASPTTVMHWFVNHAQAQGSIDHLNIEVIRPDAIGYVLKALQC